MRTVIVRRGRAKPLWLGHPWVYAESVAEVRGDASGDDADVVWVEDEEGRRIGRGLLSETSAIRVRLLDAGAEGEAVGDALVRRVRAAVDLRKRLFPDPARTDAYRLVHAEGDGLPGLVVDRFADVLVAQFATAPIHRRREALAASLLAASGARSLVARPAGYEDEEGIPPEEAGWAAGEPAPEQVEAREEGMLLSVEPRAGQKTGHYADQRENRLLVAAVAAGGEVLDLYAGTGGFSIQALRHGAAAATAVESSPRSATTAERQAELNGVRGLEVVHADVRHVLQALKDQKRLFDVVVADPPNFFPRRGGEGPAAKAYRELNVRALTRVRPGGFLASFTCSAAMPAGAFLDLLVSAARECRRPVSVLREMTAGPDHPVASAEGRYLSGALLRVRE